MAARSSPNSKSIYNTMSCPNQDIPSSDFSESDSRPFLNFIQNQSTSPTYYVDLSSNQTIVQI